MWSESHWVMSGSSLPHGLQSPWNPPGQNTGVGSLSPSPGDLPNPGIEPRPPTLQADSLPAEPTGKPKNTGVGSLSLLQPLCLTQESNPCLLHCRQIFWATMDFLYKNKRKHKLSLLEIWNPLPKPSQKVLEMFPYLKKKLAPSHPVYAVSPRL